MISHREIHAEAPWKASPHTDSQHQLPDMDINESSDEPSPWLSLSSQALDTVEQRHAIPAVSHPNS